MTMSKIMGMLVALCTTPYYDVDGFSQSTFRRKSGTKVSLNNVKGPRYNFGPASSRDHVLFTAERPAHQLLKDQSNTNLEPAVTDWLAFMKEQQISHIVALLDGNELQQYGFDLVNVYERHGFQCTALPMRQVNCAAKFIELVQEAEDSQQRLVAHCTGGVGRAGRVAAGWLVHRYNLSPEQATIEVMECASRSSQGRKGNVEMLQAWLET